MKFYCKFSVGFGVFDLHSFWNVILNGKVRFCSWQNNKKDLTRYSTWLYSHSMMKRSVRVVQKCVCLCVYQWRLEYLYSNCSIRQYVYVMDGRKWIKKYSLTLRCGTNFFHSLHNYSRLLNIFHENRIGQTLYQLSFIYQHAILTVNQEPSHSAKICCETNM